MKITTIFSAFITLTLYISPAEADSPGVSGIRQKIQSREETIDGSNPGEIGVLTFHNILPSSVDTSVYSLTPMMFEKLIEELLQAGYYFLNTREYLDYIIQGAPIPAKSVYLAFDDGRSFLYNYVYPVLQKHSIHAGIYLIASRTTSPEYLDAEQIKEMHDSGLLDFQSHTHNLHDYIDGQAVILKKNSETDEIYKQRIIEDFQKSISSIESITGEPVVALALPYGIGNETIESFAKEAGFQAVFYIGEDTNQSYGDNPFHLNRIMIYRFNAKVLTKLLLCNHFSPPPKGEKQHSLPPGNISYPDIHIQSATCVQDGIVYSSPAIGSDGTVYIGSWDKCLYAINSDGTIKWKYKTTAGISSSPAVGADGTIFTGSFNSSVYALNPDGTLTWKYTARAPVFSSPAVGADGSIYFATTDRDVIALNPDGSFKWQFWVGDLILSSPAIGKDETIYIGAWNNTLYAINPDGSKRWNFHAGGAIDSSPAVGEDGTIYVGCMDSTFYAVNPDGTLKWSYKTGSYIDSSPALGEDGTIYAGSWDTYLYAIQSDGQHLWKFKTGGKIDSSPAVGHDGTVYIGSDDGCLYAVNPDGTEKWHIKTEGEINSSPALSADGIVYVGSLDSFLYGIDTGTGTGLASSSWPKFNSNSRNSSHIGDSGSTVPVSEQNPAGFHLCNPYPNPFNVSTAFGYILPYECHVEVVLYDVLGRKVTVLESEDMSAGYHETFWTGKDSAGIEAGNGVYLFRFRADSYTRGGKIMLMK